MNDQANMRDLNRPVFSARIPAKYLIYAFLVAGFLNAVLRVDMTSSITLFRILWPFAILHLAVKSTRSFIDFAIVIAVLVAYSVLLYFIFSPYSSFSLPFLLHYSILIFLFFYIREVSGSIPHEDFYSFIKRFFLIMLVLSGLQFFYGGTYSNTLDRTGEAINIFYYNEGDLTACVAFILMFVLMEGRLRKNILYICGGFLLLLYDDARLSLIALFVFCTVLIFRKLAFVGFVAAAIIVVLIVSIYGDQITLGGDTLKTLLVDPFQRIAKLDPYPTIYGSIYTRTNAVIFSIKEFIHSYGFGIGPGISYVMLKSPAYQMADAESLHNFILQVIVELGWLGVILLGYLLIRIINLVKIASPANKLKYIGFYASGALIVTSLSSSAYSNYLLFTCFYFSLFYYQGLERARQLSR